MSQSKNSLTWVAPTLTVVFLGFWELAGRSEAVPTVFLPAPSLIFTSLVEMTRGGELPMHFGVTIARMAVALTLGGGFGFLLGLALGYSARLRTVIDPFIAALHPVPRTALLPLILLLFGIGFFSKALAVSIACFFPMVINTMAGVREIDPNFFDVAKLYGASRRRTFWRVVLPGGLPMILTGLRLAMIRALGATIALELITAQTGLGSMLFFAWQTYRSEELFATLFVIAALGFGFRAFINRLTRQLLPWRQGPSNS